VDHKSISTFHSQILGTLLVLDEISRNIQFLFARDIVNPLKTTSLDLPKVLVSNHPPDQTNPGHLYFKISCPLSTEEIAQ